MIFSGTRRLLRPFVASVFSALVLSFLPAAHAEPPQPSSSNTFQVIGNGPVLKGDISAARNAAVADSLSAAVDAAVMTILPRDALVRNFKTVGETLADKSDQFIQEYKILTESVVGSEYRVFIEAVVWTDRIQNHLFKAGIVETRRDLPTVLLLFTGMPSPEAALPMEEADTSAPTPLSAESGVFEALTAKGYTVLRPAQADPEPFGTPRFQDTARTDEDALEMGKQMHADVVVLGKGVMEPKPRFPTEPGYRPEGMILLRALKIDTGETIAEVPQRFILPEAEGVKTTAAFYTAARLAGKTISDEIAQNWIRETESVATVMLSVRGTRRLGNFVAFRRTLAALPGVKKMQMEEIRADEAVIRVEFEGKTPALADALAQTEFETFEVLILETAPDRILLALSHRESDMELTPSETR